MFRFSNSVPHVPCIPLLFLIALTSRRFRDEGEGVLEIFNVPGVEKRGCNVLFCRPRSSPGSFLPSLLRLSGRLIHLRKVGNVCFDREGKGRANKRCEGKNTAILSDVQNIMSAFG